MVSPLMLPASMLSVSALICGATRVASLPGIEGDVAGVDLGDDGLPFAFALAEFDLVFDARTGNTGVSHFTNVEAVGFELARLLQFVRGSRRRDGQLIAGTGGQCVGGDAWGD